MLIHIPNSAFIANIEGFLRRLKLENEGKLTITSNPKWMSVHPVALCMVAALGIEVLCENKSIDFGPVVAKSRNYLSAIGLFKILNIDPGFSVTEHDATGRYIPLKRIKNTQELKEFINEIIPLLHTTPEQADPIKYVISELVRNVLEHSRSSIGAIACAQYFKTSNRISIGVVDRGIGIYSAMSKHHAVRSNLEAIRLALKPGITGTTSRLGGTEYNAGAGLFFTKSIAYVSKDYFMIYSGKALYKQLKFKDSQQNSLGPEIVGERATVKEDLPDWKGTVVGIDISMDINQDFNILLEYVRKAYSLRLNTDKKTKNKKPKFI